ncbi:MAG TPA: cyclase family protein [Candidatus Sulfotelmatobacter sp.]|nr:cyclase family protein [Candidatus Sulfotelmatobacter sp.]
MKIIDLTIELADGMSTHPAHPRCVVVEFARHEFTAPRFKPPCQGFASKILMFSDHIGTHVDAPFHYFPSSGTIESVPLDKLVGPAVCLDLSRRAPDEPITPAMLEAAASRTGVRVEAGDILLFRGWPGDHRDEGFMRCAGLNKAAAEWVVTRGVKALGCDLATPDDPRDLTRPVHLALLGRGIPIMEHVAHLEMLPRPRFQFVGVPLRIKGASGSPIRALAIFDDKGEGA